MTEQFDRFMRDAAGDVPDPGEFRRLNRALLKDRMLVTEPRRQRAFRRNQLFGAVLCGLIVMTFVPPLGSDSFDLEQEVVSSDHKGDITYHTNTFRGTSFNVNDGYDRQDIDELNQQLATGEGRIVRVTGLGWGGRTIWLKHIERDINGRRVTHGTDIKNPPSEDPAGWLDFLVAHKDDVQRIKDTRLPDREEYRVMDGVRIRLQVWSEEFPGVGDVQIYEGVPAD
jgi:hypothetical protein